MAPATLESASPIGIANVSLNNRCTPLLLNANECFAAPEPTVRLQKRNIGRNKRNADIYLRHKIVAKRGAAFTIMVGCCADLSQPGKPC
jgi:hypothetical protein